MILWAVYLMFPISYRYLGHMLLYRGVEVDHTPSMESVIDFATPVDLDPLQAMT